MANTVGLRKTSYCQGRSPIVKNVKLCKCVFLVEVHSAALASFHAPLQTNKNPTGTRQPLASIHPASIAEVLKSGILRNKSSLCE